MTAGKPDQDEDTKDYSRKVDLETLKRVSDILNEKSGGFSKDNCPVCGSIHNAVLETEYAITASQTEPIVGLGTFIPAYATACTNCGYLRFFSKLMLDRMIDAEMAANEKKVGEDG